jgi:uncharacterized protein (TIGR01777 family)
MNVTVTGATGFIGSRLLERLRGEDYQLRVLTRSPRPSQSGIRYFEWDAMSQPVPAESLEGANAVIHLAGEPVFQRWSAEAKQRIRDSRVNGTRRLVEALSTASPRPEVLVSASAIGYYGNRGDEVLTEASRPGKGFLPEVSIEWERAAELAESLGIRVVRLRIGIVLGSEGGALKQMLTPFRMGVGGRLGSGKQWMSWIHLEDLIGMMLFAVTSRNTSGPVNGTAPEPVRNAEFTRTLARTLHRPAFLPVPGFGLRLMFGEFASSLTESQRVLPKAAESAGYRFAFPNLGDALEDLFRVLSR